MERPSISRHPSFQTSTAPDSIPVASLDDRICSTWQVTPVPAEYAEFARSAITKMDAHAVLVGMNDVMNQLRSLGMSAKEQYFQEVKIPGVAPTRPPIATISARSSSGEYGFPNTNQLLHAVGMRENSEAPEDTKRHTMTSTEREERPENRYQMPPEVERFPTNAPVRIMVEPSDDIESSYRLTPVFSDTAFAYACEHAAQVARGEKNEYAYILDEVIVPALTSYFHDWNPAHFGEKELPRYFDQGTNREGTNFKLQVETLDPAGEVARVNVVVTVSIDTAGKVSAHVAPAGRRLAANA